jgi:hypothetical protein
MAITFKVDSTTAEEDHSGRSSTPLVSTNSTKLTEKNWAART